MIVRLSKLVAVGVLFVVVGLSHSSETANLEEQEMNEAEMEVDMEIITMEDIDAMIEEEELNAVLNGKRGLRKLDDTCWHGGQENQNL